MHLFKKEWRGSSEAHLISLNKDVYLNIEPSNLLSIPWKKYLKGIATMSCQSTFLISIACGNSQHNKQGEWGGRGLCAGSERWEVRPESYLKPSPMLPCSLLVLTLLFKAAATSWCLWTGCCSRAMLWGSWTALEMLLLPRHRLHKGGSCFWHSSCLGAQGWCYSCLPLIMPLLPLILKWTPLVSRIILLITHKIWKIPNEQIFYLRTYFMTLLWLHANLSSSHLQAM